MKFGWNPQKAESNIKKHGISFEEALTVFADPFATIFDDPQHSIGEKREFVVGYSQSGRLLVVWFTERDEEIRIITARKATRIERKDYEERTKI